MVNGDELPKIDVYTVVLLLLPPPPLPPGLSPPELPPLLSAIYSKAPARVADPPIVVTTTSRAPVVPAGVVAVIEVALIMVTPVAAVPPTVTVAPLTKPVPVMVTEVPPVVDPEKGEMLVTIGAATETVRLSCETIPECHTAV